MSLDISTENMTREQVHANEAIYETAYPRTRSAGDFQSVQSAHQSVQPRNTDIAQPEQWVQSEPVPQWAHTPITEYSAIDLSRVRVEPIEYLDRSNYLPRKSVAVLAGTDGAGKSTCSTYFAALATQGGLGASKMKVLIVQREDPESVLKARLIAMNAEMDRVRLFNKKVQVKDGKVEVPFGPEDLQGIWDVTESFRPDLLIIDPLHGLVKGRWNDQSSADCFIQLTALAQRYNCCVLGIMHTKKDPDNAKEAISGTGQFSAKARSVIVMANLDNDKERSVMQQTKSSYAEATNQEITFGIAEVRGDDGKPFDVRICTGMAPSEKTVDDIYGENREMRSTYVDPDQMGDIAQWLYCLIEGKGGHMYTMDAYKAGEKQGYSKAQIKRAYREAGVGTTRQACGKPRGILYLKEKCTAREAVLWGTPTPTAPTVPTKQPQGTQPALTDVPTAPTARN